MEKKVYRKIQRSDLKHYLECGYRVTQQQPESDEEWAKIAENEGASQSHLKKWARIAQAFLSCPPSESREARRIVVLHPCSETLVRMSTDRYTRQQRERFLDLIEEQQQHLGRLLTQNETYAIIDRLQDEHEAQGYLFPEPLPDQNTQGATMAKLLRQILPPLAYDALAQALRAEEGRKEPGKERA